MTATIFKLRGLRADNLQAFLALLGVLRVVDLQCPQWRARARWRNEAAGGLAEIEIEAENAVSESGFVTAIAKGANKLLASFAKSIPETKKPEASDSKAPKLETSDTVIAMAQEPENRENPRAAFVGVFAAPPPPPSSMEKTKLPSPSMEKTKSPLFLLSRKQSCRTKAGDLAKLQARDYEAALWNDWSYATSDQGAALSWDPSDHREHARWHKEPTKDKKFAIEKGGLALAICGWPSFMPAPKTKGKRQEIANTAPGWREGTRQLRKGLAKWQADLSWPLWESFADLPEIEATLADNCWCADEINCADMKERGVWRVMRAIRMRGREKTEASSKFFDWAKPV